MVSACGIFDCEDCTHRLRGRCRGCVARNETMDADRSCGIFRCVATRNYESCGTCDAVICKLSRSPEDVCPARADFEKKRCYIRKIAKHMLNKSVMPTAQGYDRQIPDKSITRLHSYVFALDEFIANEISSVSSEDISRKVGVKAHLIRRDLSQFGEFGRPSVGYDTKFLRESLGQIAHLDRAKNVVWVGNGGMLQDPQFSKRFKDHGFNVVAVLDPRAENEDSNHAIPVLPFTEAERVIKELDAKAVVLAVRQDEAQEISDILVAAGIRGILNLSSAVIVTPPSVCIRNLDIVAELFALSYYCSDNGKEKS